MTLVDDPYFGHVTEDQLRHRPREVNAACQRVARCEVCDVVIVGVVAFVDHVASGRCHPIDRTRTSS